MRVSICTWYQKQAEESSVQGFSGICRYRNQAIVIKYTLLWQFLERFSAGWNSQSHLPSFCRHTVYFIHRSRVYYKEYLYFDSKGKDRQ